MVDRSNYMKVSAAADRLGCLKSNLYYHIERGNLKAEFDGATGLLLIHRDELQVFRYSRHFTKYPAVKDGQDG